MHESLLSGEVTYKAPEGIDRKYLTVKEIKEPSYKVNKGKVEGNIQVQDNGLFTLQELRQEFQGAQEPYDKTINQKTMNAEYTYPKVTFEAKELY